jgi:hypothetical protein
LGLATASFLVAGAAFAESSTLAGVTGRLDHTIDAQNAQQGQHIAVKLDREVKTDSGLNLPKDTELIGQVSRVQASENRGPSQLSLVFTKAQLKDGKVIPVKVTLVGAYPASEGNSALYGNQTMGPVSKHISPKEKIDQEAGLLSHISMRASAQGNNSATFRDKDGNVKLNAGTYFQMGIAPANGAPTNMNAGD